MHLAFVRDLDEGDARGRRRCFWHVNSTGIETLDRTLGHALGKEAVTYVREQNEPTFLNEVMQDMIKRGAITYVEIGFMIEIGEALLA